jgi:hypothetical protein
MKIRFRGNPARIGHDQGPQVNDPRAPEWKETVDLYECMTARVKVAPWFATVSFLGGLFARGGLNLC